MTVIDARGLEPPRPFELALEAICEMAPGDRVHLLLEREPHPLFRMLERNGYRYRVHRDAPGYFDIEIWLPGTK